MSGFRGTIFVYNNGKTIEYYAVNNGPTPGVMTHCIRKTKEEAENKERNAQHDDNTTYGHGNPVPAGTPDRPGVGSGPQFKLGTTYRTGDGQGQWGHGGSGWKSWQQVPIEPGSWLRVGFRGRAFAICEIPKEGEVVEIPYESLISQADRTSMGTAAQIAPWSVEPMERNGSHIPAQLSALLAARDLRKVQGYVTITPIAKGRSKTKIEGWDVAFHNTAKGKLGKGATNGFTGTVVLTNEDGDGKKNAGLGLESMPCPGGEWAAKQRIRAGGDYGVAQFGVEAQPGTRVRLGVRGYSAFEGARLPSLQEGELRISLEQFEKTGSSYQSDWFDGPKMEKKLGEKKSRVDFLERGKRINDDLEDTIYTGSEAFERAEFKDPPRVTVRRVRSSKNFEGGGWVVEIENRLPEADDLGPVGFTGQIKVAYGDELRALKSLPSAQFSGEARNHTFQIPYGAKVGELSLAEGSEMAIDTGALGWRGTVYLPGWDEPVDTSADAKTLQSTWVLRESDYQRAGLYPA